MRASSLKFVPGKNFAAGLDVAVGLEFAVDSENVPGKTGLVLNKWLTGCE